jgi:phosphohistidine phosphatase
MGTDRRLWLLRHAKSSWDDTALADHDRPLSARGEKAARRIGRHLAATGAAPALVLCSSARRTVQTLTGIGAGLATNCTTSIENDLYAASGDELLRRLRDVAADVPSAMLIAHNPGIQDLALLLADAHHPHLRRQMEAKFPTAALATFLFDGRWSRLAAGRATLDEFVVPRDLE